MVEDVFAKRADLARQVRRAIREDTECRDGFGVVLEALQVVAELLEAGKLSSLHARLLRIKKRVGGKEVHPDMSRRHKELRKGLNAIAKNAKVYDVDRELWTLRLALEVTIKILGVLPDITTKLPDRETRVPMRDFFYFMVTEGAREILVAEVQTEVTTRQEEMLQAA